MLDVGGCGISVEELAPQWPRTVWLRWLQKCALQGRTNKSTVDQCLYSTHRPVSIAVDQWLPHTEVNVIKQ